MMSLAYSLSYEGGSRNTHGASLPPVYRAGLGALFLGLIHGLWHIGPNYLFEASTMGVYWLPRFTVMWMVAMVAMRVILVWIYTNTGSLFLAQLTHASSTGALVIFGPSPISPVDETVSAGEGIRPFILQSVISLTPQAIPYIGQDTFKHVIGQST